VEARGAGAEAVGTRDRSAGCEPHPATASRAAMRRADRRIAADGDIRPLTIT